MRWLTIVKEPVRETKQMNVSLTHEELVLNRKPALRSIRPIGKVATDDTSDVREYQCDNSDCETNKSNIKINEQNVNVGENLDVKVTKADEKIVKHQYVARID